MINGPFSYAAAIGRMPAAYRCSLAIRGVGEAVRAASGLVGDLWPVFARLHSIPMLVIQREKPDLERVTVGNRGHVPLLDEPEVLAAIDRFLARLRP